MRDKMTLDSLDLVVVVTGRNFFSYLEFQRREDKIALLKLMQPLLTEAAAKEIPGRSEQQLNLF